MPGDHLGLIIATRAKPPARKGNWHYEEFSEVHLCKCDVAEDERSKRLGGTADRAKFKVMDQCFQRVIFVTASGAKEKRKFRVAKFCHRISASGTGQSHQALSAGDRITHADTAIAMPAYDAAPDPLPAGNADRREKDVSEKIGRHGKIKVQISIPCKILLIFF
jgi:hypothetical protein